MARRIIERLRAKIRAGEYVVPFHAASELDDDDLSIFDVEKIVDTGDIVGTQRDAQSRERKYLIKGQTVDGEGACCVVKIGPTGKIVIVTAWLEEGGHAM